MAAFSPSAMLALLSWGRVQTLWPGWWHLEHFCVLELASGRLLLPRADSSPVLQEFNSSPQLLVVPWVPPSVPCPQLYKLGVDCRHHPCTHLWSAPHLHPISCRSAFEPHGGSPSSRRVLVEKNYLSQPKSFARKHGIFGSSRFRILAHHQWG